MKDYNRFLVNVSKNRKDSVIRAAVAAGLQAKCPEKLIFMSGGLPNPLTFPFSKIIVDTKQGDKIILEGTSLNASLQYLGSAGYGPLIEQLKEFQNKIHNLEKNFWEKNELLLTTGSLDGVSKAIEMCLNQGDPIIMAEPSYSGIIDVARPFNAKLIAAVEDEFGVCPIKLRKELEKYGTPEQVRNKSIGVPKLLYLNPTGGNPSGTSIPTQRKHEIYKIACEYDLIILEDDPYYFINFQEENPVSFLSMDTENRVLRFDSFSKILSAGIRLGFVTGPKELVERISYHIQVSTMHASSLPQVILHQMLNSWGHDGFMKHLNDIKQFYHKQRDAAVSAAEKHLKGLAEWNIPQGGMFLWMRIPGVKDVHELVVKKGFNHGIIFLSGESFMMDDKAPCNYIRASYSLTTPEQMDTGFARFATIIKEELKSVK